MKTAIAYSGTLLAFLALDALWLGFVARTLYRDQLGDLMLPSPNLAVAAVFYIFFPAAVVFLAVLPGISAGLLTTAILNGAVLGLAAYGTYDITNLATLKNWPTTLTFIDMAWGAFLTAFSAAIGFLAVRMLA